MTRREGLGLLLAAGTGMAMAEPVPGTAGTWPRTLVDAMQRSVRIAAPPRRIVTVFPSNVEILFALGLADRVAAIGGRVRHPPEAVGKPSVGGALGYSPEAVAAHRPDLLVLTPSHQTALSLVEPFTRAGVPVLMLAHPDLPSVLRNITLVGQAAGVEAQAEHLRRLMQQQLEAVRARWQGLSPRSVYLETAAAERGAFQTIGRGHYADDALAWAGGRNVFADLDGSQQVSAEAIAVRDPEVILSLQAVPKPAASIAARPGWQHLRAVREGRVVVLERGHKLIPGPRQIEAVLDYARALHPERFA
jgi:iron complex transport system substrate-binding protein